MTLAERFRSEGRVEGHATGETAALRKMAIKMLDKGMNTKQVAELTEISRQELQVLLAQIKKKG